MPARFVNEPEQTLGMEFELPQVMGAPRAIRTAAMAVLLFDRRLTLGSLFFPIWVWLSCFRYFNVSVT